MKDKRLKIFIVKALILLLLSIAVGIFIPGIINYQNKSFSAKDIFNRLDTANQNKILANDYRKELIRNRKADLLNAIQDTSQEISEITRSIEDLNKIEEYGNDKSIKLTPFYPKSKLLLLWPFLYFGLSVLVFLIKPKYGFKIDGKTFWIILLLLILFVRWPTWMRNTFIGKIDRVVYAISNYDISKVSFFMQEIQSVLSLVLVTFIICKWLSYAEELRHRLIANTKFSELHFLRIAKDLRTIYQEWQVCSLFLALAFGYYTYYFWATINESGDYRYLPHAIIVHIVWALTWFVISLPLITIKNYQLNYKENFLRRQISSTSTQTLNKDAINLILSEDPISTQNQTITALISGATFLLPIIKAFL